MAAEADSLADLAARPILGASAPAGLLTLGLLLLVTDSPGAAVGWFSFPYVPSRAMVRLLGGGSGGGVSHISDPVFEP